MARQPRILILGGYGLFGSLLARELLQETSAHLVIGGRHPRRAARACGTLGSGDRTESLAIDLHDHDAVLRAASGCFAVACTAGPFQDLDRRLPAIVTGRGAHWIDIADDPEWVSRLLSDEALDRSARVSGVVAIPGLSTIPALSGALARWCVQQLPRARRARITLFIGNHNRKGAGTIASALRSRARDPVLVDLPVGRHRAYRFDSPDELLLEQELGLHAESRVAFEWSLTGRLLSAAQALIPMPRAQSHLARWLSALSSPLSRIGSDVGCLQVEALSEDGRGATACLVARGQRLAVIPCALAIEALLAGEMPRSGCLSPATWLAPEEWIARLRSRGMTFEGRLPEDSASSG